MSQLQNSGHFSQESRGRTTPRPSLSHKQKITNFFLLLLFSPTRENIFVCTLLSVRVQSVLYCFQTLLLHRNIAQQYYMKNYRLIPKSLTVIISYNLSLHDKIFAVLEGARHLSRVSPPSPYFRSQNSFCKKINTFKTYLVRQCIIPKLPDQHQERYVFYLLQFSYAV